MCVSAHACVYGRVCGNVSSVDVRMQWPTLIVLSAGRSGMFQLAAMSLAASMINLLMSACESAICSAT